MEMPEQMSARHHRCRGEMAHVSNVTVPCYMSFPVNLCLASQMGVTIKALPENWFPRESSAGGHKSGKHKPSSLHRACRLIDLPVMRDRAKDSTGE